MYLKTLEICVLIQSVLIYELDPAKSLSSPELAWQVALKKAKVKLDLLADINMLFMAEKGISGRMCHSIYWYAKANKKCIKDYDKNKESSYIQYQDVNNLYSWAISQWLSVNNFEWIKNRSQFNEGLIKNYNKESNEGYFLEFDDLTFTRKNENWKSKKTSS